MRRFAALLLIIAMLTGIAACAEGPALEGASADVDAPVQEVEWTLEGEAADTPDTESDVLPLIDAPELNDETTPDAPTTPEEPTNPDEPTNPETPTNPDQPTDPENPTDPEAPETPEEPVVPTVISIKKSAKKTVYVGTEYQIEVPGKTIKSCKSSAKKIAKVSDAGILVPKKEGNAKITVKLSNRKKLTLTLKVVDPAIPKKVAIDAGKQATLLKGDTLQLTAAVYPETADQKVKWKSSDKSVAVVSEDGLVTAVATGKATITATTVNKKTATLTLTVNRVPGPVDNPYMISHALGGVGGYDYTNSLEGFTENYAEGHRVFEVDIELTSDSRMVLCHDWKNKLCSAHKAGYQPTYKQFMGYKLKDRYTPLSLEDLLRLMDKYPDIRVITDTKYTKTSVVKSQFKTIVSTARKLGVEKVLDRLTVEVYTQDMYKTVKGIYPFKSYVFTLYKLFSKAPSNSQLKTVGAFCKKNHIGTVAMYTKWWKPKYADILDPYGVEIALYSTNDPDKALEYFNDGVTALFTDFLMPI